MPSERIGSYEMEYSAAAAADGNGWVAHVAIYGASNNPMHRNNLFPEQRVSLEVVFETSEEAEAEAFRVGSDMLKSHSGAAVTK